MARWRQPTHLSHLSPRHSGTDTDGTCCSRRCYRHSPPTSTRTSTVLVRLARRPTLVGRGAHSMACAPSTPLVGIQGCSTRRSCTRSTATERPKYRTHRTHRECAGCFPRLHLHLALYLALCLALHPLLALLPLLRLCPLRPLHTLPPRPPRHPRHPQKRSPQRRAAAAAEGAVR